MRGLERHGAGQCGAAQLKALPGRIPRPPHTTEAPNCHLQAPFLCKSLWRIRRQIIETQFACLVALCVKPCTLDGLQNEYRFPKAWRHMNNNQLLIDKAC
ncbi:jg15385 [Pararge aegeria aegeria]|uniref:Jg15385 protein n=1 Tax=Pararge aegeria aegeria TaxID=348720 RepID=A0A8S4SAA0_9NEOP|nr:jg15385 [Pararge aegeria aegeria]